MGAIGEVVSIWLEGYGKMRKSFLAYSTTEPGIMII